MTKDYSTRMKPSAHMDSTYHCSSVQWSLSGRLKLWLQSESPDFPWCHFTTSQLIESFRSGCQLLDFSQFCFQMVCWWIRKLKIIQYFQNSFSYFYYGKEIWFCVFKVIWNACVYKFTFKKLFRTKKQESNLMWHTNFNCSFIV